MNKVMNQATSETINMYTSHFKTKYEGLRTERIQSDYSFW